MRVTNPMVTNRMMLNIHRNMRQVDKLYNQLATGKRITFPSDDPILAGRALKFRTNVYATEQYQRNVAQGISWMEITEGGFANVTSITSRIRELLVQGASDENSYDDRLKIVNDIEQLFLQLGSEMNVSYAGRYVFSGYRTDQPPILEKANNDTYIINQNFKHGDIETIDALQSAAAIKSVNLAAVAVGDFTGIDSTTMTVTDSDGNPVELVVHDSLDDMSSSLDPNKAYYIEDEGILVLGSQLEADVQGGVISLDVEDGSGFDLEVTGTTAFSKTETLGYNDLSLTEGVEVIKLAYPGGITLGTDRINIIDSSSGVPTSTKLVFDSFASLNDVPNLKALGAQNAYFIEDTGTLILGSELAEQMRVGGLEIDITYQKTGFEKGDLNPCVYFECVYIDPANIPTVTDVALNKYYDMDNQNIEYEFGVGTRININSLSKDVYTDKMYADLLDFCNTLTSITPNTLETIMAGDPSLTVDEAGEILKAEQDMLRQMAQMRFNNLIGKLDTHIANVSRERTDLGSRMNRIELIENRLIDDRLNYKQLLSDNEDTDYTETAMELNSAESVYQAALQIGAKITQLTLADYIR